MSARHLQLSVQSLKSDGCAGVRNSPDATSAGAAVSIRTAAIPVSLCRGGVCQVGYKVDMVPVLCCRVAEWYERLRNYSGVTAVDKWAEDNPELAYRRD